MKIALVGNPNSGKSTLFSALTGEDVHTGNWPGKTVEIFWKSMNVRGREIILIDLPGVYSLEGKGELEKSVVSFFEEESPDVALLLVDPRAFYYSIPLLKFLASKRIKTVILFNFLDELEEEDKRVVKSLEKVFPSIAISARRKWNLEKILEKIPKAKVPDSKIIKFFEKKLKPLERSTLGKLDRILLTFPGSLFFLSLFSLTLFYLPLAVSKIFLPFVEIFSKNALLSAFSSAAIFIPVVFAFYFIFSFLEDTGLMARATMAFSYLTGLPGRPVFPFLMGVGCNVLGVEASKILKKESRENFCSVVPLIPCSTRLAVLATLLAFMTFIEAAKLVAVLFIVLFLFLWLLFWKTEKDLPDCVEIPKIRMPSLPAILELSAKRTKKFVVRVVPWIFLGFLLGELLQNLFSVTCSQRLNFVILSLAISFFAKESLLGVVQSCTGSINLKTILGSYALPYLAFFMFYLPCLPTLTVISRNCGIKVAMRAVGISLLAGFLAALLASI